MNSDSFGRSDSLLKRIPEKGKTGIAVFLICYLAAFLVFLPLLIKGDGILTLCLDFNAQELPFNVFANREIKAGNIFFNWGIDIGSDFISSLSFYNVGSPFFWITLLFPPEAFPCLTGFLFPLKYAVAGLTAYLWIDQYSGSESGIFAAIGGILYAFSGFQAANVVFYHMHDAVALFPLLLLGLDELVRHRKWKLYVLAIFLNICTNWVLFVGEALFLVIYYCVRYDMFRRIRDREAAGVIREILRCFLFACFGAAAAAFILLPSITSMMGAERVGNHLPFKDWWLMYPKEFLFLIRGLLFPAEPMDRISAIFSFNWYSVTAYLPMVSIAAVIAYLTAVKEGRLQWIGRLLLISGIMALIPILNSAFSAFNVEPYRRWFYMPLLLMALASALTIEKIYTDISIRRKVLRAVHAAAAIMVAFGLLVAVFAKLHIFDVEIYLPVTYLACCVMGTGGVVLFGLIARSLYQNRKLLWVLAALVLLFGQSNQFINVFKYNKWADWPQAGDVMSNVFNTAKGETADVLPYRWDMQIFDAYYNCNMANSLTSRNSFISALDNGIFTFYDSLGVGRHTLTLPGPAGTGTLLSARYLIAEQDETVPDGYQLVRTQWNGERYIGIYENDMVPPIGFTYDSYILKSEFESLDPASRAAVMLRALVVRDEAADAVSALLEHYAFADPAEDLPGEIAEALMERGQEASEQFEHSTTGFRSVIHASADKYAFFSVPYSRRWKASVNGQAAGILNVNGLMAVPVSSGDNEIVFKYDVTLHRISAGLSIAAVLILIGSAVKDKVKTMFGSRKTGK